MNESALKQGQSLSAIETPEGSAPWKVGGRGVKSITVTQLAGPMGWYDAARIAWDNGYPDQIIPLHQCDFIATCPEQSNG